MTEICVLTKLLPRLTGAFTVLCRVRQIAGFALKYDSLPEIRQRLSEVAPNLTRYGDVEDANYFKQAQQLSQVSATLSFKFFIQL